MKLIRRIGPLRMMALKVTAQGAFFWFAWAFTGYQAVYLQNNGFAASEVGVLNALSSGVAILSVSFWGTVSDRIGSLRKVLFLILLCGCGLYALIPLIPTGQPYSTMLFLTALPLINFFRGSAGPMSENIQVRNCNEMRFNFGLSRATGSLFYTLGGLLAAFLLQRLISVAHTFILSFVFMIPVLCMIPFVREPKGQTISKNTSDSTPELVGVKDLFHNKKYLYFLIFAILFYTANSSGNSFVPYYMKGIGVDNTLFGVITAYRAFLEIPLLILMSRLRRKFSLQQLLAIGVGLIAMESIMLCFVVRSLSTMLLATTFYGLGNGMFIGTSLNYLYQLSPPALRARGQAFYAATSSAAGIAGNLIGGILFDQMGGKYFYLMVSAIYLVSILLFLLTNRSPKTTLPKADSPA